MSQSPTTSTYASALLGAIPDDVPPEVAAILTRHTPVAAKMNAFYGRLFHGDLHAEYPDT